MYTREEEAQEFWMLTKGFLQDSQVDTDEAKVIRRWLQEHGQGDEFATVIKKLDEYLADGFIGRFESENLITSVGTILRMLRAAK